MGSQLFCWHAGFCKMSDLSGLKFCQAVRLGLTSQYEMRFGTAPCASSELTCAGSEFHVIWKFHLSRDGGLIPSAVTAHLTRPTSAQGNTISKALSKYTRTNTWSLQHVRRGGKAQNHQPHFINTETHAGETDHTHTVSRTSDTSPDCIRSVY